METVENKLIATDYRKFEDIAFTNCKFTYQGGQPPELINCSFTNCQWVFEGNALNTLNLLKSFGGTKEGQKLVKKDFLRF